MLDRQALLELGAYRNAEQPVVSVYLAVDRNSPEDPHLILFKNLVAEADGQRGDGDAETWEAVEGNLERMREWLRGPQARAGDGAALFASGDDLWQAVSLPYEVPTAITIGDRARLRPLMRLLQRYDRYLTILSDARDARLFLVTPDETREIAQVEADTPNRHEQGGWSQARIQRHQDRKVEEHLENAAERAFRLFQSQGFDGVVLMGTDERTSLLQEQLHPYLRQRVLECVPMDVDANPRDVGTRTLELAQERRRERQGDLLGEWEGHVRGGNRLGVAGLADTLGAAQQGQLMTVFMREDLALEGGQCEQCGTLTDKAGGSCDYCGGTIQRFDDVTEALTAAALDQGAELIFLAADGDAARMDEWGGVGAILRYAIP